MPLAFDPFLAFRGSAQRTLRWTLGVFLFVFVSITSAADLDHRDYIIRRWTTDDGLPQNRISSLAQTPDGLLWIGSWFGLTRFDGVRFRVFNRYNTPSMPNESVNSLAVDKAGALYIGFRAGLLRMNDGVTETVSLAQFLPDYGVWDLATTAQGILVVDTGSRSGALGNTPVSYVESLRLQLEPTPKKLTVLADGSVGSICAEGIAKLPVSTHSEWIRFPKVNGSTDSLRAAVNDGKGGYWLGTRSGLFHQTASGESTRVWTSPSTNETIEILYRDSRGILWVGVREKGLHRLHGNTLKPFELIPGQSGAEPSAFLEDRESNLWIGTTAGLFQIRSRFIRSFTQREGVSHDSVVSVAESKDGTIWLATGNGLTRLLPGASKAEPVSDSNRGHRSVCLGADGRIYTDHWKGMGLESIHPDLKSSITYFDSLAVESLYTDLAGRIWMGYVGGVKCLENGVELSLTNLPTSEVRVTYQAKDGALWFGTWGQGLYRWDDGKRLHFNTTHGLSNDRVFALHEDAEGYLWAGTYNGLTRLHSTDLGRPFKSFTVEHGLLDNLINHIVEDDMGDLWMSCNRGIFRMSRASLNQVADGILPKAGCAVFGASDGMASSETNGEHQPAGLRARDGRFWFPTTEGVVVVSPSEIPAEETKSTVVLEEVVIDGTPAHPSSQRDPVIIPPGGGRLLLIRYTLPTFVNSQRVQFRHRLLGLSEQWHEAGEQRVAYFTNLKPGSYEFQIHGATAHGVWSETPATFAFTVEPLFTQTPYFPAALTLGGLLIAVGCTSWRIRWQRAADANAQALKLEQERARIAADLHDELGSKLTALSLRSRGSGIEGELRQTAERLRELVWAVDPQCDSLEGLVGYLVDESERLLGAAGINLELEIPSPIPKITLAAGVRRQLALVIQEALTNAVRHSGATRVSLKISLQDRQLNIEIADDGRGGVQERQGGRGLSTMKERMKSMGGSLTIHGALEHSRGTRIEALLLLPAASPGDES